MAADETRPRGECGDGVLSKCQDLCLGLLLACVWFVFLVVDESDLFRTSHDMRFRKR
ncbi:hypothetical protein L1049_026853 [Liquidambar formosana]|uniref:Uncharacterized protein n=1 Tax=Liquidambar formosana TaxID=63359 RepID=A0AAP0NE47_LIQFO